MDEKNLIENLCKLSSNKLRVDLKGVLFNQIIDYLINKKLFEKTIGREKSQLRKKLEILETNIEIKLKILESKEIKQYSQII